MTAFIYTGGTICPEGITDHPRGEDITIAADSGYRNAKLLKVNIDIAVGDFDSLDQREIGKNTEIMTVPAEKDFTDTQMAVDVALSRNADHIVIIGGLSGRVDHTLSNLGILEKLYAIGIRAILADGNNRVRYINATSELIPRGHYRYFSLLAADSIVKGVTIEGGKYPLKNAKIKRTHQFAVSNEIEKNCALISVKKGGLFIIESRDPS
jgi:thiamine pyrophosphokinase